VTRGTALDGPLHGYRVLDLADEAAALCGKMFADLGADVVKVEPPGGCSTRGIPPFLDDEAGPDSSCYFQAMAAGKRSVTLDLEQSRGRQLFGRLAETADFLVESFPLGHLDGLGLSYRTLADRNPRLVHTTVTPFGDRGPAAAWKAVDIVAWAASGMMSMMGGPGRPPLQLSVPQACFHAGSEAAVASLLAHLGRERSGVGQHTVVDMQATGIWATNSQTAFPALGGPSLERNGMFDQAGHPMLYRCVDGHVQLVVTAGMYLSTTVGLVEWMDELGLRPPDIADVDFAGWTSERFLAGDHALRDEIVACEAAIGGLLARFTRAEILDRANERGWLILPVGTIEDVAHDEQLRAREYFRTVAHPGLDRELTVVGPFARLSASPAPDARRAPMLGEHNVDVLRGELGVSAEEFAALRAAGVIADFGLAHHSGVR
jgi:benzylsuccinate CoA-transferase BbsE subunit